MRQFVTGKAPGELDHEQNTPTAVLTADGDGDGAINWRRLR